MLRCLKLLKEPQTRRAEQVRKGSLPPLFRFCAFCAFLWLAYGACHTRPSAYFTRMRTIFSEKRSCSSRLREVTLTVRVGGELIVTVSSFVFPGPTCSSLVNCCRP